MAGNKKRLQKLSSTNRIISPPLFFPVAAVFIIHRFLPVAAACLFFSSNLLCERTQQKAEEKSSQFSYVRFCGWLCVCVWAECRSIKPNFRIILRKKGEKKHNMKTVVFLYLLLAEKRVKVLYDFVSSCQLFLSLLLLVVCAFYGWSREKLVENMSQNHHNLITSFFLGDYNYFIS